MYVYVKNWNIVYKSDKRSNLIKDAIEMQTTYTKNDNIIFEDGEIRIYEKTKQFEKDVHKYRLDEKIKKLEHHNKDLEQIANKKITKDLELNERWLEANEYQRKIYLLKNLRNGNLS